MPPPEAVIELLVDPRHAHANSSIASPRSGSATDWRAYAAGGGAANDGDDATAGDRREDEDHEGEDDGEEAV